MKQFKYNLLINNLNNYDESHQVIINNNVNNILGYELRLPVILNKPFIFSCFATSVDGKLCYPDLMSGFAVAKSNYSATEYERYADWWSLLLGRAISDAVIIGSNSIIREHNEYFAGINIDELCDLRKQLGKPSNLLHIVITRDANKIDWSAEQIVKNNDIPLIILTGKLPNNLPEAIHHTQKYDKNINKQIILDNELDLVNLINDLYESGIKVILNESPYYHHYLQQHELLDEAWLNTSGVYIGGDVAALGINNHSFLYTNHPHYTILTLHHIANNFLYTRYKINYGIY